MKRCLVFASMALGGVLTACAPATEAPTIVERQLLASGEARYRADTEDYHLIIVMADESAAYDLSVSNSPDGSDAELIFDDVTDRQLYWAPEDGIQERNYFVIEAEGMEPVVFATRVLPLEGGRNFRDLGGYGTVDGRYVKWGKVFRSGVMDRLTDADYAYLSNLGIKVLCDLRTAQERTAEPTSWSAGDVEYLTFPDPSEATDNPIFEVFLDPDVTSDDVRNVMIDLYSNILEEQSPAYRVMFDQLANGDLPLAFNCSAGKDRTGVGAALILSALGVHREIVIADYEMSEQVVDYMAEFNVTTEEPEAEGPYDFLRQLPPDVVAPLMRSDPAYIRAVLDRLDAEYGGVTAYIQAELDVSDAELAAIQDRLLE